MQLLQADHVGRRLRTLRQRQGASVRSTAKRDGLSAAAVSAYERGRQTPGLAATERLCAVLGVSVAELLSGKIKEGDRHADRN